MLPEKLFSQKPFTFPCINAIITYEVIRMSIFKKPIPVPIPEPFSASDIKVESSTCTGEKTIGFFDKTTNRLAFAELVRTEKDIANFYKKYGIDYKGDK